MSSVTTKPRCGRTAVHGCVAWTQRLSFPSTAVARRKTTNRIQECLCAKHNAETWTGEAKQNATVLTWTILLWQKTWGCRMRSAGWCGVGIFTLRSDVRLWWIIRGTPTFGWKQSWIYSFHGHDLSHHELVYQRSDWDDDEEDGCACCSSCTVLTLLSSIVAPKLYSGVLGYWCEETMFGNLAKMSTKVVRRSSKEGALWGSGRGMWSSKDDCPSKHDLCLWR